MHVLPHRYLSVVRRWVPIVLLGVLVAAVPAYVISSRQTPSFEASAELLPQRLLPEGAPDFNSLSVDRMVGLSSTWALIARTPEVLAAVKQRLGLVESETALARRIFADTNEGTAVLTIAAQADSPEGAVLLANTVAQEVEDRSSAVAPNDPVLLADLQNLNDQIFATQAEYEALLREPPPLTFDQREQLASLAQLLESLNASYATLALSVNRAPQGLDVLRPATVDETGQLAPRPLYYTLLAGVIGLLVAAGLAYALQYADDRLKSPEDVRAATGMVMLGAFGKHGWLARRQLKVRLAAIRDPDSRDADVFRSIRTNIDLAGGDTPLGTILVTSSAPVAAKTIVASNVAAAFAQAGRRVVLVDSDLRKPAVHTLFGLRNAEGLTSLLRDSALTPEAVLQPSGQVNLSILTAGPIPRDPAGMLGSDRMRRLTERLLADADLLIFDGAPMGVAIDSSVLSATTQGTVVVLDAGHSSRPSVVAAVEELARARANILGAVLYNASGGTVSDYRGRATADVDGSSGEIRLDTARTLKPTDPA